MSAPEGAKSVEYYVGYEGDNPELIIRFVGELTGPNPNYRHAAFEAAADAMVAFLAGEFPDASPSLIRTYHGTVQGDPWPDVEPAPEGES
jgi:hypothetical protein